MGDGWGGRELERGEGGGLERGGAARPGADRCAYAVPASMSRESFFLHIVIVQYMKRKP